MKKLRALHVIGTKDTGGAETFFLRLTSALSVHIDVELVVRKHSWIAKRLHDEGIRHHALRFGGHFDFATKRQLKDIIFKSKPQIIQTWMSRASSFLPLTNIPTVARLGGYYDAKHFQSIMYFVGNSKSVCNHIQSITTDPGRTFSISNFVELPSYEFHSHRSAVRKQIGIPESAKVIMLAGRFHPVKGFDIAIQALAKLPEDVYFIIAGQGSSEKQLKQLVANLGLTDRVKFPGWVNSISQFCAASDVFLISSRQEPLGNVVLEAWVHNLPVVATATEGPSELITDGESGLLVPINDSVAMADALTSLLSNFELRDRLRAAGVRIVSTNHSKDEIVKKYLEMYQKILEQQGKNSISI